MTEETAEEFLNQYEENREYPLWYHENDIIKAMESYALYKSKEAFEAGRKLEDLFKQHQEFAEGKFPESTWDSSLKGLRREIRECLKEGKRLLKYPDMEGESDYDWELEYVDCFMYLLDSMNRAGIDMDAFKKSFEEKLQINKDRDWKKNKDNSYSHV